MTWEKKLKDSKLRKQKDISLRSKIHFQPQRQALLKWSRKSRQFEVSNISKERDWVLNYVLFLDLIL